MPAESASIPRRRALQALAAGAAGVALPGYAVAQARTIRLVVPAAAGELADLIARAITEPLAKALGQPVVVEIRPGAAGASGAALVAQAAPDALTLLLSHTAALAIAPFANEKPPYDPLEGFTHVAGLAAVPCVLIAPPRANLTSLADLEARARKEAVTYGSPGPLSLGHVYGELLKQTLKLNLVHQPARGPSLAQELLAGAPPLAIDLLPAYAPQFQSGQLIGIAVTSADRAAQAPDVPSVADFGYGKLVLENVFGLSTPAKLPSGHLARLAGACQQALALPDVQKKLAALGARPMPLASPAFTAVIKSQVALLGPVVRTAGLK
jgi:tripartite-type tricarboxylate transporter receptor subunit TctC